MQLIENAYRLFDCVFIQTVKQIMCIYRLHETIMQNNNLFPFKSKNFDYNTSREVSY